MLLGLSLFRRNDLRICLNRSDLTDIINAFLIHFFPCLKYGPDLEGTELFYAVLDKQRTCRFASFVFRIPSSNSLTSKFMVKCLSFHYPHGRLFFSKKKPVWMTIVCNMLLSNMFGIYILRCFFYFPLATVLCNDAHM